MALLLADFERAELVNIGVSADNLAATERQLEQEAREAAARRNDRVAAARPRTVYGPYNTKLGIAGTFLPSGGGSGAYGGGGPTSSPPPKSSDE